MKNVYRVIFDMRFNNEADRDQWYASLKTTALAAKGSLPAYENFNMTKNSYTEPESTVEKIT